MFGHPEAQHFLTLISSIWISEPPALQKADLREMELLKERKQFRQQTHAEDLVSVYKVRNVFQLLILSISWLMMNWDVYGFCLFVCVRLFFSVCLCFFLGSYFRIVYFSLISVPIYIFLILFLPPRAPEPSSFAQVRCLGKIWKYDRGSSKISRLTSLSCFSLDSFCNFADHYDFLFLFLITFLFKF